MSDLLKKRLFIIFGSVWSASLVVLVLFYFVFIGPKIAKIAELDKQLEKVNSSSYGELNKKSAQENLEQCREFHGKICKFVIDQEKWLNMMPYLADVADDADVSMFASKDVSGDKIDDVADSKKIGMKYISVSFNSNFFKFARFINMLEGGDPVVFLKDFTIDRSPDNANLNSVKMQLVFLVSKERSEISELFTKLYSEDKPMILGSIK